MTAAQTELKSAEYNSAHITTRHKSAGAAAARHMLSFLAATINVQCAVCNTLNPYTRMSTLMAHCIYAQVCLCVQARRWNQTSPGLWNWEAMISVTCVSGRHVRAIRTEPSRVNTHAHARTHRHARKHNPKPLVELSVSWEILYRGMLLRTENKGYNCNRQSFNTAAP